MTMQMHHALAPWEPFGMLREFEGELGNLMSSRLAAPLAPKTDIAETDKGFEIALEVPGIDSKDLSLEVRDGVLTVNGERNLEEKEEGKNFVTVERSYGRFSRAFRLPDGTDEKGIKADCKNGVLTVAVPKTEAKQPRSLKIEVK